MWTRVLAEADTLGIARSGRGGAEGATIEIWLWIIGVVAVIILAVVLVDRRHGSTGASKSADITGSAPRPPITFRGTKGD